MEFVVPVGTNKQSRRCAASATLGGDWATMLARLFMVPSPPQTITQLSSFVLLSLEEKFVLLLVLLLAVAMSVDDGNGGLESPLPPVSRKSVPPVENSDAKRGASGPGTVSSSVVTPC